MISRVDYNCVHLHSSLGHQTPEEFRTSVTRRLAARMETQLSQNEWKNSGRGSIVSGPGRVLLITGPGGSGKSTLAKRVSEELGWECISEDAYWVRSGWGAGLRSSEHEQVVQAQVGKDLLAVSRERRSAVLEFILYKDPPNPLTAYQELLSNSSIAFNTVVLKPSVDEILRRMQERGRPNDLKALELRRPQAEHQVQRLETKHIDPRWVIDPTGLSIDEVVHQCIDLVKSES